MINFSSLRRRPSPERQNSNQESSSSVGIHRPASQVRAIKSLAQKLSRWREDLLRLFKGATAALDVLHLVYSLIPALDSAAGERYSTVGRLARAREALETLHSGGWKEENGETTLQSDALMLPTLGSQEGAFENVRMNYNGEQVKKG